MTRAVSRAGTVTPAAAVNRLQVERPRPWHRAGVGFWLKRIHSLRLDDRSHCQAAPYCQPEWLAGTGRSGLGSGLVGDDATGRSTSIWQATAAPVLIATTAWAGTLPGPDLCIAHVHNEVLYVKGFLFM